MQPDGREARGVQLARVALLRGDVDQASAYGIGALESTNGSTWHRSRQQLVDLRDRLKSHSNRTSVTDFQERARLLLAS
jgi:hypothetical protein